MKKIITILILFCTITASVAQDYFGSHSHKLPNVDFAYSAEGYCPYNITSSSISVGVHLLNGFGAVCDLGVRYGTVYPLTPENSTTITMGKGFQDWYYTFNGLQPSTLYYITIWGKNYLGEKSSTVGVYTLGTPNSPPIVSTAPITNITGSTASGGGNCTGQGGSAVTGKGTVWSIYQSPTIAEPLTPTAAGGKTSNGTGIGSFTSNLTGLAGGTKYYVRAYATNSYGTSYGSQIEFTTTPLPYPRILALSMTTNTGEITYDVVDNGTTTVFTSGFCWGSSNNPTISDSKAYGGGGFSQYTVQMTGVTPDTHYFGRAFAESSIGIGYSQEMSFTSPATSTITTPTVLTASALSVTSTTAVLGGNVTSSGNANVTDRGVEFSRFSNFSTIEGTVSCGSGTGVFSTTVTGLNYGTLYYYRAYATNSAGTARGTTEFFTTSSVLATLSSSLDEETEDLILVSWNLSLSNPSLSSVVIPITITNGSGTGTSTTNFYLGAGQQTATQVIPYAKLLSQYTAYCNFGTIPSGYSGTNTASYIIPALTPSCTVPVLATNSITSITTNSATSGGVISSDGSCSITSKGVQWSLTSDFSTIVGSTSNGTGTGSFTSSIAGLNCGTTYYVRSYATNTAGTGYGSTVSFITNSSATVSIASFSAITSTSFTANCSVTSSCSNITSRGIIYSTSSGVTYPTNAQSCGSGTGTFDCSPYATLSANTTYYVKAYAIINGGSIYLSTESTVTTLPTSISVGDTYNGGVVAYIFQSGDPGYVSGQTHGIIAATSDQSSGIQWYNGSYVVTDATSEGVLGGGLSNTNKIVSVQGSGSYAAKLCYDLTLNGYSDWVLPNMGELRVLYANKSLIGGFSSGSYWSSYEGTSMYAGLKSFNNGDEQTGNKSADWIYVRAIRYF